MLNPFCVAVLFSSVCLASEFDLAEFSKYYKEKYGDKDFSPQIKDLSVRDSSRRYEQELEDIFHQAKDELLRSGPESSYSLITSLGSVENTSSRSRALHYLVLIFKDDEQELKRLIPLLVHFGENDESEKVKRVVFFRMIYLSKILAMNPGDNREVLQPVLEKIMLLAEDLDAKPYAAEQVEKITNAMKINSKEFYKLD